MRSKRPVIGITGPDYGGLAAWFFTSLAVLILKGRPLRITPNRRKDIDLLDGLVIGGGADISPDRYGIENSDKITKPEKEDVAGLNLLIWVAYPLVYFFRKLFSTKRYIEVDRRRDELEFHLLAKAIEKNIPVLGICRGAQLINIHFGGTLHQDLREFYVEIPQVWSVLPKKRIIIKSGTRLSNALNNINACRVNALHRQAIKSSGEGINISAYEPSRVIQAIEHRELPFIIGVQWHPEYLFLLQPVQRNLFRALIDCSHKNQSTYGGGTS